MSQLDRIIKYFRMHYSFRCFYCGTQLRRAQTPLHSKKTRDHVIPKAKGGKDGKQNIVPCCLPCNADKRDSTLEEFRVRRYGSRPIEFFAETMFRQRKDVE